MNIIQNVQQLQGKIGRNRKRVKDYWKENELDGIWRKYIDPIEWDNELNQEQQEAFMKEVNSRKIKSRTGKDILRWENSTKGTFTIKEAYYLADTQVINEENQEWMIIWRSNWWLKVSLFTWRAPLSIGYPPNYPVHYNPSSPDNRPHGSHFF